MGFFLLEFIKFVSITLKFPGLSIRDFKVSIRTSLGIEFHWKPTLRVHAFHFLSFCMISIILANLTVILENSIYFFLSYNCKGIEQERYNFHTQPCQQWKSLVYIYFST
jgi:hypothetical protein